MARRTVVRPTLVTASWSSPVLLDGGHPRAVAVVSRLAQRPRAAWPWRGGLGRDNRAARRTCVATVTSARDQVPDVATLKAEGWQFDPPWPPFPNEALVLW